MPHIVIEHSADFTKTYVHSLQKKIPQIMAGITEGNFDADQCKCRSVSFDEYLVGIPDQSTASFMHISIKILGGRSLEARKKLSAQVIEFIHKNCAELNLASSRCDLSVDIIEMDRETYQKLRI